METFQKYKVVKVDGLKLTSVCSGPHSVEYRPGEWAEAKIGGLLVFDTLDDAQAYIEETKDGPLELWMCECNEPVELPDHTTARFDEFVYVWDIYEYFREIKKNPDLMRGSSMPWHKGTSAFKRVRLTRFISRSTC